MTGYPEGARCAGLEPHVADQMFFNETPGRGVDGRVLCRVCPVRDDCLVAALQRGEAYGIFGGLTAAQRGRLAGAA